MQDIDRFGYQYEEKDHSTNQSKTHTLGPIQHDTKAVEYYLRLKLKETTFNNLSHLSEIIHFALTSEDLINIAYAIMLTRLKKQYIIPELTELLNSLAKQAREEANTPMLGRTHGQNATPTTFGKEMANYLTRLKTQLNKLNNIKLTAKLNGATGNYNAHNLAFPKIDWISFSKELINSLNLTPNLHTTQIESHDTVIEFFQIIQRINNIIQDLCVDMWLYISNNYFIQENKKHEVGSSTMPHKINPWRCEVAEGSTKESNAKINGFTNTLQTSRYQRDLSDHVPQRAMGVALAHTYIAITHLRQELSRLTINKQILKEDLENKAEVLTEAIQTILRKENHQDSYELLKHFSRGKNITLEQLHQTIDQIEDLNQNIKGQLKQLTPSTYIGLAPKLAINAAADWEAQNSQNTTKQNTTPITQIIIDLRTLTENQKQDLKQLTPTIENKDIKILFLHAEHEKQIPNNQKIQESDMPIGKHILYLGAQDQTQKQAQKNQHLCVNCTRDGKLKFNITQMQELLAIINMTTELN